MKKIGLLTSLDPLDKTAWSGIYYKIYETLINTGYNVEILGPYPDNKTAKRIIYLIETLLKLFSSKRYYHHGSLVNSFFRGRYFSKKLRTVDCDIVLGITSANEFAFLKTKKKLLYFTDSSFDQLSNYYPIFSNISKISRKEAGYIENRTLKKVSYVLYPSEWAKNFSLKHYGISEDKIEILKMGSNIEFPLKIKKNKEMSNTVKFLFLGVNWERKGGRIVLETLNKLVEQNYQVELTVCGCTPDIKEGYVTIIPFLNKNIKEEYEQLKTLLYESHFLFLPTQAECYGIVFAEASAYGLPSIAMDTGGVSSVVKNKVNGILLKENSPVEAYVEKIKYFINNPKVYKELGISSRKYFESELDWRIFGEKFKEIVNGNDFSS